LAKATVATKKASPKASLKADPKTKKAAGATKAAPKTPKPKASVKTASAKNAKPAKPASKKVAKPAVLKPAAKSKVGSTGPAAKAKKSDLKTKPAKSKISDLPEDELDDVDVDVLESVEDIVADVAEAVDITAVEIDLAVEEVEEKTAFDLVLDEVPADKKIAVLKIVREITGLGLKDAKDLVESAPKTVKEGMSKADAEAAQKQIAEAGGKASVK
jgi:ribosomal protein L7/L12